MADLTITAANVAAYANERVNNGYKADASVTAGQAVYLKSSNSRWALAQHDGTGEEAGESVLKGIALHAAAAGQPLAVMEGGDITIGATIADGVVYYLSGTAGGICPVADLGSADRVTIVGYGISTSVMRLLMTATGRTLA